MEKYIITDEKDTPEYTTVKILVNMDCSEQSDTITRVTYNVHTQNVVVQTNTAFWQYFNVPLHVWMTLLNSTAIDDFIKTRIKPSYIGKKIQ